MSWAEAVVSFSIIALTLVLIAIGLAAAWCMIDERMDDRRTGRRWWWR